MRARLFRIPPGVCATLLLLAGLAAAISALFWWPPSWPELWLVMIGLVLPPLWAGWLLLRRRRWVTAVLGVGLLGLGALGVAGILTGAYHYVRLGGVWASLESRERHAVPDSRPIALTYVNLPARTAQPANPIVFLAGGPGGSAILTRLLTPRDVFFTALRDVADVVLFEQRGAMPWGDPWLACPETWSYPLDRPFEPAAGLQAHRESLRRCVREHESNGIDVSAYNTRESVGDLEILRRRLGAPRLTLWATSYGTHLALAYLRQFPDRVGALVLHGVEGPDHTLKRPTVVDAGLADLTRRFSGGDEPPRDFVNEVATLIDELRDTPRPVPVEGVEVTIGPFDLQLFVTAQMGTAASRARLVAALDALALDDYAAVARFARSYRENRRDNLMGISTDCASGASETRHAAIWTDLETSVTGNAINYPFPEICAAVPFADLGPEFRAPVASNVRALFVSGTLDGRTPVSNAEEVFGGFPRGEHLIVDGAGHVDEIFISSPVILESVLAFLREESLPTNRISVPFSLVSADR